MTLFDDKTTSRIHTPVEKDRLDNFLEWVNQQRDLCTRLLVDSRANSETFKNDLLRLNDSLETGRFVVSQILGEVSTESSVSIYRRSVHIPISGIKRFNEPLQKDIPMMSARAAQTMATSSTHEDRTLQPSRTYVKKSMS